MHPSVFVTGVCVFTALLLTGCGEMVFKRGADPGSMANAQSACRARTDGEAAYIACMEQQGYVVKGSQQSVFVGGADVSEDDAASGARPDKPAFFVEGAAVTPAAPRREPAAPAPVAPAAAKTTQTTKAAKRPEPAPPAQAAPEAAALPKPAAAPKPAADPMELVDVSSWWKLGGSPAGLEAAQADCIAKLGNAHRPAPDGTLVTRGLIACLRDAGWRGIGR